MNPVNPDSRPLPSGWNQHYDPSRNTWYYVCTNFKPPRVSTNHPLGPLPEPRSRPLPTPNVTSGMDRSNGPTFPVAESPEYTADPPSPRTSTVQPKASKLSFAQQLYASAAKPSQAYTPPTIAIPSIPTPPLSPPPNSNHRSMPIPPIPPFPSGSAYASGHYSASSSHNPVVSSQRPQSQHGTHDPHHSLHSPPSHHDGHFSPHRTQSYQPFQTSHQQNSTPVRASTYSAGMMSKPKATPNLTTTLRPPPNGTRGQLQKKPDTTAAHQTLAPPPHLQILHVNSNSNTSITTPIPSYPSPPTSVSPSSMLNTATYSFQQPLPPTPVSPLQFVQQTPTFGQTLDTLAGVAGGALSTGALSEDGNFMSSFADASSLGIQNGGNNNSQSQAAVQGQPGADYQSFLNSYAQQQPAQPPGVDYQTLIQMQQAQNAQQQQTMLQMNSAPVQTIDATYVDAYNAQLQASQQQYQYQAALDAQAQMNAAAAQEQQAQAMLQAYQQQQQQQLLQLQLQQQQQAAQQQQALQQLLLQQQLQQVQAVYGQQPALPQQAQAPQGTPLVNLLRFGHALSTFASDSGNSVDAGALAGGDGGLMSFFGDFSSDS